MDIAKLQLLIQIASYEPVGGMDAATVMNELVPMGWAFAFSDDNGSVSFAVMKEVRDIIKTVEEPDVKEHMVFMSGIRYMVRTCMGLYGVCTLREVRNIFLMNASEDKNAGKEEAGDVDKILQEFLPFLEEDKELWLDGKYIVSPYFKTERAYQELLRRQKKNYYIPDSDEILSYGAGSMTIKNDEYKAVFRILNREVKDQAQTEEMLSELSEYVIREDWEIPEIMNCLYDWDVAFSSDRAADKLVRALSIWLNVTRRWSECGHNRKELLGDKPDLEHITYIGQKETAKKIYPNAPCPCGSGKNIKNVVAGNNSGKWRRGNNHNCINGRKTKSVKSIVLSGFYTFSD